MLIFQILSFGWVTVILYDNSPVIETFYDSLRGFLLKIVTDTKHA